MEPFRNECIPELIYQYYGLIGRAGANINAALDEFSNVPLNLIALCCNAIEAALMEVMTNQPTVFTTKHFAPKWDGMMAVLETLEAKASEYLEDTQQLIWKQVRSRSRLNAGPNALEVSDEDDEWPGGFIPLLQLCASNPQSKEPGSSKAASQLVLSSTKASKIASQPLSSSVKAGNTPPNPPKVAKKPRSMGASTSESVDKRRRNDDDGSSANSDGWPGGPGDIDHDDEGSGIGEGGRDGADIDELKQSGEGEPTAGNSIQGGA
ncbi:uncharacterized protein B0H18DRAFT_312683 [Fomitopsis serialis]|uniref:uncharacterized protein n=1 Tax=Fomitopsis serialis TaxID=139415 RepID=UPI0020080F13|nr:uncharacterized protein B0H18DRAFT_312683 [Neoantrodia serialis]KAH9936114.1 hypothetical protein B0H18DRAFT_312683 [Neoantrodia serialis]